MADKSEEQLLTLSDLNNENIQATQRMIAALDIKPFSSVTPLEPVMLSDALDTETYEECANTDIVKMVMEENTVVDNDFLNTLSEFEDNSIPYYPSQEETLVDSINIEQRALIEELEMLELTNVIPIEEVGNNACNTADYMCGVCSNKFISKSELEGHLKHCHSKKKPHNVKKKKRTKKELPDTLIKRINERKKKFTCNYCEKKFKDVTLLTEHMRNHSGEKPYACDICEKAFSRKRTLITHKIIHSEVKPYACNKCGQRFTQKGNLKAHMIIHTGEKPYECEHCDRKFSRINNFKIHNKRAHSGPKLSTVNKVKCDEQKIPLAKDIVIDQKKEKTCKKCKKKFLR